MLLFLFGWGPHTKDLGSGVDAICERCHNRATMRRVRTSIQVTCFFVPILRWRRQTFDTCPVCGHGRHLPAAGSAMGERELQAA